MNCQHMREYARMDFVLATNCCVCASVSQFTVDERRRATAAAQIVSCHNTEHVRVECVCVFFFFPPNGTNIYVIRAKVSVDMWNQLRRLSVSLPGDCLFSVVQMCSVSEWWMFLMYTQTHTHTHTRTHTPGLSTSRAFLRRKSARQQQVSLSSCGRIVCVRVNQHSFYLHDAMRCVGVFFVFVCLCANAQSNVHKVHGGVSDSD